MRDHIRVRACTLLLQVIFTGGVWLSLIVRVMPHCSETRRIALFNAVNKSTYRMTHMRVLRTVMKQ